MEENKAKDVEEGIREEVTQWEEKKSRAKKTWRFRKTGANKHGRQNSPEDDGGERISKKRKHSLILNWGEE